MLKLKENQKLCGERYLLELLDNSLSINDLVVINSGPDQFEIITNQTAGFAILSLYEAYLNESFKEGYELNLEEKLLVHKDDRSDIRHLHCVIPNNYR